MEPSAFLSPEPIMNSSNPFDLSARNWDADPLKVARARAVAEAIQDMVPLAPGFSALEYGCGTGLVSFALASRLGQVTLADSSPGMLAVVAEKLAASPMTHLRPLALDLTAEPLPADRFQLIYTLMTLHHVPDVDRILADFSTLLTSPGYLCVADLDAEDGSFHGSDFSGHRGFDRDELGRRARSAGFATVEFRTVYRITKESSSGQKEFPLFLMVAGK